MFNILENGKKVNSMGREFFITMTKVNQANSTSKIFPLSKDPEPSLTATLKKEKYREKVR